MSGRATDQWSRVRELGSPDWGALRGHGPSVEQGLAAANGWWIVDSSSFSDRCTVYVTDCAVYAHIKPDTIAPSRMVRLQSCTAERAAVVSPNRDTLRLAIVGLLGTDLQAIGVDLHPSEKAFADVAVSAVERAVWEFQQPGVMFPHHEASANAALALATSDCPRPPVAAAGWHPDPLGRFEHRYWDGHRWTQHVHSEGIGQSTDPPVPSPPKR